MKSFKIVFYKSEQGELVHVKTFYRLAEQLADLVKDPPEQFFEMLATHAPVHGWAEIEPDRATVFVIFVPRDVFKASPDEEEAGFREWLSNVKPADFKNG